MKTIEQVKDCQAIDLGYNSFRDLVINPKQDMQMYHLKLCIERSMKEYAGQAIQEAADRIYGDVAYRTYEDVLSVKDDLK